MRRKEHYKCAERYCGNVERRAYVPAEICSNILENGERGNSRANEEHIYISAGGIPENEVYGERHRAERDERYCGMEKIFFCFGASSRKYKVYANENKC